MSKLGQPMPRRCELPSRELTDREREVAVHLANGLRHEQIASRMGVSGGTVKFYVTKCFEKLDIFNRKALADYARQKGWA